MILLFEKKYHYSKSQLTYMHTIILIFSFKYSIQLYCNIEFLINHWKKNTLEINKRSHNIPPPVIKLLEMEKEETRRTIVIIIM